MRTLLQTSLSLLVAGTAFAQFPGLTLPASGKNQKASVIQNIGPVEIRIDYSSPAVHAGDGTDRRGKIWGTLVPYGLAPFGGFGNGKATPWRAGANENTVITLSNDLDVEGQTLPAGRYGLFMIPGETEWTVIFSKNSHEWGSFFYEDADDVLRVKVNAKKHDYQEWLTYAFPVRRPTEAVAELQWEDLAVPITFKVKNIENLFISKLKEDLANQPGFSPQGYMFAAQYTLQSGKNLEQGLEWAELSISRPFIGEANFNTLSTKAQILSKLGREEEAKKTMLTAVNLPGTNSLQIHQYGRTLLTAKKNAEALEVFQLNAKRNGDAWPVHVGLARAYAALGDNKQALEHAKKALPQAPDDLNRKSLEGMVKSLSEGQGINQ